MRMRGWEEEEEEEWAEPIYHIPWHGVAVLSS